MALINRSDSELDVSGLSSDDECHDANYYCFQAVRENDSLGSEESSNEEAIPQKWSYS